MVRGRIYRASELKRRTTHPYICHKRAQLLFLATFGKIPSPDDALPLRTKPFSCSYFTKIPAEDVRCTNTKKLWGQSFLELVGYY